MDDFCYSKAALGIGKMVENKLFTKIPLVIMSGLDIFVRCPSQTLNQLNY